MEVLSRFLVSPVVGAWSVTRGIGQHLNYAIRWHSTVNQKRVTSPTEKLHNSRILSKHWKFPLIWGTP
jgi:hypothetical protein